MEVKKELVYFSSNVLHLRKKYGYTQKEMAAILGVSISSLRKVESGVIPRCITAKTIYNLCRYFEVSADLILNENLQ